ncbi:S49 family peptidase [Candidatus Woesearchaeota archaeon]|nr:S49 family peptidase [Candidatus Woesearchaeota archaeon]
MNKKEGNHKLRNIILTIIAAVFILLVLFPLILTIFDPSKYGNVALIKIEGVITSDGSSYLGSATVSSPEIINFIQEADQDPKIKAILLEINSPGGSPVASDEIGTAVKRAKKPTIAVIREVGASGGYWIASAADHIIANRMSITGSIGVYSSYLEFSGLMEKYGIGYERLVAGEHKDTGFPILFLSSGKE